MRPVLIYGSILFCLIIGTVLADRKWKHDDDNADIQFRNEEKKGKRTHLKTSSFKINEDDTSDEDDKPLGTKPNKKNANSKKSLGKNIKEENEEDSSEEEKAEFKSGAASKKFIGRIEHGKVKVLRRKADKNHDDHKDDEDDIEKVCRKSKDSEKNDCNNIDEDENYEEDEEKPKKRIKYSIKFAHEKQKKKEAIGDISIMRIHKNGKRRFGKDDDDDSSEEDDKPLKRFHLMDEDD